jgi:hypothetical protein
MGAFNEWTKGTYLEQWRDRRVVVVARNLLHGACVLTRLHLLRCQGVRLPVEWAQVGPMPPEALAAAFGG